MADVAREFGEESLSRASLMEGGMPVRVRVREGRDEPDDEPDERQARQNEKEDLEGRVKDRVDASGLLVQLATFFHRLRPAKMSKIATMTKNGMSEAGLPPISLSIT